MAVVETSAPFSIVTGLLARQGGHRGKCWSTEELRSRHSSLPGEERCFPSDSNKVPCHIPGLICLSFLPRVALPSSSWSFVGPVRHTFHCVVHLGLSRPLVSTVCRVWSSLVVTLPTSSETSSVIQAPKICDKLVLHCLFHSVRTQYGRPECLWDRKS